MPRSATQQAQNIGRLRHKLQKAQAVVDAIQKEIEREEAILLHISPQADLERIPPRPSRLMDDVPQGYWAQQALDVMRVAHIPLTVLEIADMILARRGLDPASEPLRRDYGIQKVRNALKWRKGRYCQHDESKPQKWILI